MAQQTAVDWLFIQLYEKFEMKGDGVEMDKVLEQAKKIEREQIIGLLNWMNEVSKVEPMRIETDHDDIVDQYYTKTYGK